MSTVVPTVKYLPVSYDGQKPKLEYFTKLQPDTPKTVLFRAHHPDGGNTPSRTQLSPTGFTSASDKEGLSHPYCPSTSVGGLPAESVIIEEVFLFSSSNYKILTTLAL